MKARLALLTSLYLASAGVAHADAWTDLWSTHEQQAQRLLDSKHPEAAAPLFSDARRRAYAELEAGQYAKAAKSLAPFKDADSQYNRGNALAHEGQLRDALTAYDAALAAMPGNKDVIRNRDLVKRALEEQKSQSGQQGGSDGKSGSQGSKGGQSQGGNHSPGGGQPQPGGQSQAGNQQPGGQAQANNRSQSGQPSQGGSPSQSGSQQGGDPSQPNGQSQANNQNGGSQSQSGGQSGKQPDSASQAASQAQGSNQQQAGQSQGANPQQQGNPSQARNPGGQSSQAGGQSQAANQAQGGNSSQAANPSQSAAPTQAGATHPGDNTAGEGALAPNGQQTDGSTAAGGLNAENAQQDANAALRYRQSQQGGSGSETNPRGTASVLSPDGKSNSSADVPPPKPPSEQSLALDQWLRGIPDDSAELLRRKFLIEHMLKQQREEP